MQCRPTGCVHLTHFNPIYHNLITISTTTKRQNGYAKRINISQVFCTFNSASVLVNVLKWLCLNKMFCILTRYPPNLFHMRPLFHIPHSVNRNIRISCTTHWFTQPTPIVSISPKLGKCETFRALVCPKLLKPGAFGCDLNGILIYWAVYWNTESLIYWYTESLYHLHFP